MSNEPHKFIDTFDYIVVGSGAGGGTLAARLAEGGANVLLLEAGPDVKNPPVGTSTGDWPFPDEKRIPDDYDVPVLHALSTENKAMKWDYFVRHFSDQATQEKDLKFVPAEDGILYPRTGALGGCTAHNAMITIYPHNADWDGLAQLTGDSTWRAGNMRKYFERIEDCHHRAWPYRWLAKFGINHTQHGWKGWLQTEKSLPIKQVLHDKKLVLTVIIFVLQSFVILPDKIKRLWWLWLSWLDPNDWRPVRANATGMHYPPLTTKNSRRHAVRERVIDVQARFPDRLRIQLNTLVTRVLFDDERRAIGVEYEQGERLYQAAYDCNPLPGIKAKARAAREVILAGGAFNTPQLLQLSGIGPREELEKHGIPVLADLPGVGQNLQDRYEVCVVNEMNFPNWEVLKGATFSRGDAQYAEWETNGTGVYGGNGAVIAAIRRSFPERPLPDLFCFAVLAKFYGYFPGYSQQVVDHLNIMSWAILKAHTNNRGGFVKLRSADPHERPEINFRYFEEGTPGWEEDLDSVVEGVRFARELFKPLYRLGIAKQELMPGPNLQSDDELREYCRTQTWGHHASCTCQIGSDHNPNAVLDGNFRVRGIGALRVVDASVFPRIPDFFILTSVFMIAEKAADVILADYYADQSAKPEPRWWQKLLQVCLFCGR